MSAFQGGLILMRVENHPTWSELSGTDRLVLAALFTFAADKKKPEAFPSATRLAARAGVARETALRSLARLEAAGTITGQRRDRRPTRWALDPYFIS